MSFEQSLHQDALQQFNPKQQLRKRYLVTQGELFMLYKEICAIRKQEDKNRLMANFKTLLQEAQQVHLTINKKGGNHGNR